MSEAENSRMGSDLCRAQGRLFLTHQTTQALAEGWQGAEGPQEWTVGWCSRKAGVGGEWYGLS